MGLEGPWLSTTSTKKRIEKLTKAQQLELETGWKDRNKFLKGLSLAKETFEQYLEWVYGKGKKEKGKMQNRYAGPSTSADKSRNAGQSKADPTPAQISLSQANQLHKVSSVEYRSGKVRPWDSAAPTAEPKAMYTGTKMIGITVLHKSCLQPVFSQEEAIDAAKMRR